MPERADAGENDGTDPDRVDAPMVTAPLAAPADPRARAREETGIGIGLEADRRFAGYGWYDALPRVSGVRTEISSNGKDRPLEDFQAPPERSGPPVEPPTRPDGIRMKLDVVHPGGTGETLTLDADLAFAGEAWAWLSDVRPLVTAESAIEPSELADILRDAFFSPSDESDADSWETQRTRFEEEAMHIALGLLCSEEEARRNSIAEAVRRELSWLMPRDRAVTITVRGGEVGVRFADGEVS